MGYQAIMQKSAESVGKDSPGENAYQSVEFNVEGFNYPYQFKVRKEPRGSMHVLVSENSEILKGLKVGSRLNLKYYTNDFENTTMYHMTEIRDIDRIYEGRFRGHYAVGLSIVGNSKELVSIETKNHHSHHHSSSFS
jgi:hypothetical protein